MHDFSLLYELFVVLCSATIVVLLVHRLRVPHIIGFLLCGVAVGPHGLNLVTRIENIDMLAEIGVVFLLFSIGLEFSLAELRRMKRYVLLGGLLQVLGTIGFTLLVSTLAGADLPRAIFLGQIISLSSTAIVLSALASRGEMETLHGRIVLGILLFQDLCVVPMMLITPLLGGSGSFQLLPIALSLGKAFLLIAIVMVLAVFVVPRLLEILVRVRLREILVLGVVVMCIGTAWLTSSLGLSLALGAFIAGLAISESPHSHQVFAEILPFKDVFNSIFFISVGMLLDLKFLGKYFPLVLALVLGTLLAKTLMAGFTVKILSGSTRMALLAGLAISQVGEFSFVLAKVGVQFQLLSPNAYQGFLATAVMTMMATPLLMALAPRLAQRIPERFDSSLAKEQELAGDERFATMRDHTIIVGFGLNGRYLAQVLKDSSISYCALELNPKTVHDGRNAGEPICFGDASRLEILRQVNFAEARILVVTTDELAIARRIVSVARQNHKKLYIIVRTKFAANAPELHQLGADEVIAEEHETAIEIFAHVLSEYDLPRHAIDAYIDTMRRDGAAMFRKPQLAPASLQRFRQLFAGSTVENFLVLENSPACGRTLSELDFRNQTGAMIIAVVRDNQSMANPSGEFVINVYDMLVVMGNRQGMERTASLLQTQGVT